MLGRVQIRAVEGYSPEARACQFVDHDGKVLFECNAIIHSMDTDQFVEGGGPQEIVPVIVEAKNGGELVVYDGITLSELPDVVVGPGTVASLGPDRKGYYLYNEKTGSIDRKVGKEEFYRIVKCLTDNTLIGKGREEKKTRDVPVEGSPNRRALTVEEQGRALRSLQAVQRIRNFLLARPIPESSGLQRDDIIELSNVENSFCSVLYYDGVLEVHEPDEVICLKEAIGLLEYYSVGCGFIERWKNRLPYIFDKEERENV